MPTSGRNVDDVGEEASIQDRAHQVVVNGEGQYSILPEGRMIPAGWRLEGFSGPKSACLAHIDAVWTDLRPISLRAAMDR